VAQLTTRPNHTHWRRPCASARNAGVPHYFP
jgi:hypothetical protein